MSLHELVQRIPDGRPVKAEQRHDSNPHVTRLKSRLIESICIFVVLLGGCSTIEKAREITRVFDIRNDAFNKKYVTVTEGFPVTLEVRLYEAKTVTITSGDLHLTPMILEGNPSFPVGDEPVDSARVSLGELKPGHYVLHCDCGGTDQRALIVVNQIYK